MGCSDSRGLAVHTLGIAKPTCLHPYHKEVVPGRSEKDFPLTLLHFDLLPIKNHKKDPKPYINPKPQAIITDMHLQTEKWAVAEAEDLSTKN